MTVEWQYLMFGDAIYKDRTLLHIASVSKERCQKQRASVKNDASSRCQLGTMSVTGVSYEPCQ